MKFSTILTAALAFTVTTVAATPTPGPFSNFDPFSIFGKDLGRGKKYGAPRKPWEGGKPGWYFGKHPGKVPRLPCLTGPICKILKLFPWFLQCPTPPPPNPGPSDGFGLVDTIAA